MTSKEQGVRSLEVGVYGDLFNGEARASSSRPRLGRGGG